jgi:hypothetical protein
MIEIRLFLLTVCLFFSFGKTANAQTPYVLNPNKTVAFEMTDALKSPLYEWPQTLVSYAVKCEGEVTENDLVLTDKTTNKAVPFQLSNVQFTNGKMISATVNFLTGLASGGQFAYVLSYQKNAIKTPIDLPVKATETGNFIELGTDNLKIMLPNSQTINGLSAAGPLSKINNGTGWMGDNKVVSSKKKIISIATKTVEKGSLFAVYQVVYAFENGSVYSVLLTVVSGYPFVIVDETMTNINETDGIKTEYAWTNFTPEKRWANQWDRVNTEVTAWRGVDEPLHINYAQEDPHWTGDGQIEDPSKEMTYFLIPFGGNGVREQTPQMSFWETGKRGNELGVFVYDFNRWKDDEYGIWQTSTKLAVKFRYTDKILYWHYPLSSGSRSTAICLFPTEKGNAEIVKTQAKISQLEQQGGKRKAVEVLFRYPQLLKQQYATFNLDKVKTWQLSYEKDLKHPKNPFEIVDKKMTAEAYVKEVMSSMMAYYPLGVNNFPGVHAIEHRPVYGFITEGYLRFYKELTAEQRQRIEALLLTSAYVNAQEDMNAIRSGLSGTANMAADGWCVPAQIAFLFPEHPQAKEWLDFYQKELEINGLFYTRPAVKAYDSKGGRWVESLSIYNWAYMRPTSFSNLAGVLTDGKNRWANPYFAERGKWLADVVTAPVYNPNFDKRKTIKPADWKKQAQTPLNWKVGDALTPENGYFRNYPAHGAHGFGTTVPAYIYAWELAHWLKYYDPLTAEHLWWASVEKREFESSAQNHTDWSGVAKTLYDTTNLGTNPHLKSVKYTGQGIILRGGVGTPEEVALFLDQVDKGPNYRWGHQGQGGAGSLYFQAGGKIYTGHENEVNGDFSVNNTDFVTNFGVMKNNSFSNIGANELTAPLFDLGGVQFAELLSAKGADKYAYPEYVSRSALLVGTDYFLLYDETGTNWRDYNRFSWFVAKDHDFPKIIFLNNPKERGQVTTAQTLTTRGFYRDGDGSCAALISPKKEVTVKDYTLKTPVLLDNEPIFESTKTRNNRLPSGVYDITTATSNDLVFRNDKPTQYTDNQTVIDGKTGVIRRFKTGEQTMAVFYGKKIGTEKGQFAFSQTEIGWSANVSNDGDFEGKVKALAETTVKIVGIGTDKKFYLNGELWPSKSIGQGLEITIPKGDFYWEINDKGGTPQSPRIERTEYLAKKIKVYVANQAENNVGNQANNVANTAKMLKIRFEMSKDNGKTWTKLGDTKTADFTFDALSDVNKIHIRAIAVGTRESAPSDEYPVYFERDKPHYPEGLQLTLGVNSVQLSWGKVLGASTYKLYRRRLGDATFTPIYEGLTPQYFDKTAQNVIPAYENPSRWANLAQDRTGVVVYEYAVTTVNGLGESALSPIENTDPAGWTNWYPNTMLKFKRQSAFWLPPYVAPNKVPSKYYPD